MLMTLLQGPVSTRNRKWIGSFIRQVACIQPL